MGSQKGPNRVSAAAISSCAPHFRDTWQTPRMQSYKDPVGILLDHRDYIEIIYGALPGFWVTWQPALCAQSSACGSENAKAHRVLCTKPTTSSMHRAYSIAPTAYQAYSSKHAWSKSVVTLQHQLCSTESNTGCSDGE